MSRPALELCILGPTEIRGAALVGDEAGFHTPKRLALLSYLAIETSGGFRRRDHIVGLFWPDLPQDGARTQLRKALFALREGLGSDTVISRGDSEIRLNPERLWCDAVALDQSSTSDAWAEALALYRGDLLEGLFPEGVAQEFHDWLADKRRHFRGRAAAAAWELSREEEERGDRRAAAVAARRALDLVPDDENGIRRLMTLMDQSGDRGGALRVYSEWRMRLSSEYGVEPAPETRRLVRKVQASRKGESHETPPPQLPLAPTTAIASSTTTSPVAPPRLRLDRMLIAVAALAVAGSTLTAFLVRGNRAPPPAWNSVGILPIRAIGELVPAAAAEAITEELSTTLMSFEDLHVRPPLGGVAADSAEQATVVGQRFRVAYVLDGGVQRSGDSLRATLRLVRTSDNIGVWAGRFDLTPDASAMRRMVDEAARAIRARIASPDATNR